MPQTGKTSAPASLPLEELLFAAETHPIEDAPEALETTVTEKAAPTRTDDVTDEATELIRRPELSQPRNKAKKASPRLETTVSTGERSSLAPLWRRGLAFVFDFSAIGLVVSVYLAIALIVTGRDSPKSHLTGLDALMLTLHAWGPALYSAVFVALFFSVAYASFFAVIWDGQTPGRRLGGIRLVCLTGSSPTPPRAAFRALFAWLSAVFFFGGYWLLLFDRRRQSLHDKMTGTVVINPSG